MTWWDVGVDVDVDVQCGGEERGEMMELSGEMCDTRFELAMERT